MCTLQRISELDFQLCRQSIQPETQTATLSSEAVPLALQKKYFVVRLKCCMWSLEPIQSFLLLPAGTMGSLSSQPSHILKEIQMENVPSPKRNSSLLMQEYSFPSLSRAKTEPFVVTYDLPCELHGYLPFWSQDTHERSGEYFYCCAQPKSSPTDRARIRCY